MSPTTGACATAATAAINGTKNLQATSIRRSKPIPRAQYNQSSGLRLSLHPSYRRELAIGPEHKRVRPLHDLRAVGLFRDPIREHDTVAIPRRARLLQADWRHDAL